jgi:hypothetical protein
MCRPRSIQPDQANAKPGQVIQYQSMLTRLYVEALLIDSVLADQVWELWNAGVITDFEAA